MIIGSVSSTAVPPAPWRTCLDIESQSAEHYHDKVNEPLLGFVDGAPKRVLELGCAMGHFGAKLKERFPGAQVIGVDANRAAAAVAATRIDRVICDRLEDLDFAAHGLAEGGVDAIIAADILEHLSNPWRLLERLRRLLSPDGQLLASIPNVRNLALVSDLVQGGHWSYRSEGLLDITHLRFFTLYEMHRMFEDTGYRTEKFGAIITRSLNDTYQAHREKDAATVQIGRMTLTGITPPELLELCTEQFLFRCRPDSAAPA